jgi:predicted AlkP superfamily phosphohydrolase/phosphomutase
MDYPFDIPAHKVDTAEAMKKIARMMNYGSRYKEYLELQKEVAIYKAGWELHERYQETRERIQKYIKAKKWQLASYEVLKADRLEQEYKQFKIKYGL